MIWLSTETDFGMLTSAVVPSPTSPHFHRTKSEFHYLLAFLVVEIYLIAVSTWKGREFVCQSMIFSWRSCISSSSKGIVGRTHLTVDREVTQLKQGCCR